jgi:hypothetical protein
MNILLVTGPDGQAVQSVWQTLQAQGLQAAQPSRREKMLPEHIHDLMRQSRAQLPTMAEYDDGANPVACTKILGKVWHELASDLCLGNINNGLWGWAMDDTGPLLDYWLDFDPGVRLVLVYTSPIEHLQHHIQGVEELTPLLVERALLRWVEQSEALLVRFHSHSPRCLLVHAIAAKDQGTLLAQALDTQRVVPTQPIASAPPTTSASLPATYQQSLLAEMTAALPAAQALWQELQATAHLCAPSHPAEKSTVYQHWAQQAAANSALAEKSNEVLALVQQAQYAIQTIANLEIDNVRLASTGAAVVQENDRLLLQLHQVQEELEHYFLLHEKVSQQLQLKNLPTSAQLNMCEPIEGRNWYHAESDGRWAGPGLVSTLQMPPVAAGRYKLELYIQDAMQPDIVLGQELSVVGQGTDTERIELVHNFAQQDDLYPMVSVGVLDLQATTTPWALRLALPHNLCPAESGGDDTRHLGLKLQAVQLTRQEILNN